MIRVKLAAALLAFACSTPAFAQGRSQGHRKTPAPPSRSDLAAPATVRRAGGVATPFAWIDDATLLDPGSVSLAVSALRWQGSGVSEVDVPVVDIVAGLGRRVHFSATVPHVVGSADPAGAIGGLGTSYFSLKMGIVDHRASGVKVAVSPTIELLSRGAIDSFGGDGRRAHFGLPVSAELDRGAARLYGSGGYFSRGLWFVGAGIGYSASDRLVLSTAFSRAWQSARDSVPLDERARNEVSGGAAYSLTPVVSVFGSIGRTIATLEENGAGTTIGGGIVFSFASSAAGHGAR